MPNNVCGRVVCLLLATLPCAASAFSANGHRIAGIVAAPLLCERARPEITALVGNRSLEDIGHWADTVRDDPAWQHSAPWHYLNVDDASALRELVHPPEGDAVWAIDNFTRVLADRAQPSAARATALQFLVHLIVDLHQPLHVGLEADRGGNTISVRYGRTETNLHAFWDNDAIVRRQESPERYARDLADIVASLPRSDADTDPLAWASESLALRSQVYAFDRASGELDRRYLDAAETATARRLAQAAVRLAATLNGIFCGS